MATEAEVRAAYAGIGRTNVDQEGLRYWMGQDAAQLGTAFMSSAKDAGSQSKAAEIDSGYAGANPSVKPTTEIADNYRSLFNRAIGETDKAGSDYWASTGLSGANLTDAMKSSADLIAKGQKYSSPAVSNYSSNGVRFDRQGRAVGTKTATTLTRFGDSSTTPSQSPSIMAQNPGQPSIGFEPQKAATDWTVDPRQTVASQIETLIAKDSPLMQQARTRALQSQNESGRLNSTMAASAGEAAAYDTVMPIATADARMYGDAAQFNATNQSNFSRDFNAWQREREMANFNVGANDWAADRNMGRTVTLADLAAQRDEARAGRDYDREVGLRGIRSADSVANDSLQRELRGTRSADSIAGDKLQLDLRGTRSADSIASDSLQREMRGTRSADSIAGDASNIRTEDATVRRGYMNSLTAARSDFATQLASITRDPNISSELKSDAIKDLRGTFNRTITNFADLLDWQPKDWIIEIEEEQSAPATAKPVASTASPASTASALAKVVEMMRRP